MSQGLHPPAYQIKYLRQLRRSKRRITRIQHQVYSLWRAHLAHQSEESSRLTPVEDALPGSVDVVVDRRIDQQPKVGDGDGVALVCQAGADAVEAHMAELELTTTLAGARAAGADSLW